MGKCITVVSSIVSLVSTCILAVLFMFPPVPDAQAVWIHTGIYVQFIIGRLFGIAVLFYRNYLDGSHELGQHLARLMDLPPRVLGGLACAPGHLLHQLLLVRYHQKRGPKSR